MNKQLQDSNQLKAGAASGTRAGARIVVVVAVAFVLGLTCGGFFYYRHMNTSGGTDTEQPVGIVLSDSTRAVLQRLDSPVDLKFYVPSDRATLPETLGAFAARVQQLLAEYERVGAGNIRLLHSDPAVEASAKAAAGADGVLPFAGQNGEICYLGVTVARAGRKETIAQLSPDWEAALESDLSRAIARVSASVATPAAPAAQGGASPTPIDPAISEEILRVIPDLEARSFDQAASILRESALAEFTVAVREMQSKVQETEQQLASSSGNKSEADQQTALKQLREVQDGEAKKIAEITARLQARIQVLERLKGVNRPLPK